jgi:hypothetical protein
MSTSQRVTIPRDMYEPMAKIWALYSMGLLVPAPADSPIKMPPRDAALSAPRHTPEPVEPPIVGTVGGAPDKLDENVARIPALGLGSEWTPTNAAAPPPKQQT